MLKSEFQRQTGNKYNQTRVKEIHMLDLVKIQSLAMDNGLTMEEATKLCYDSKYETAKPSIQYERCNVLVDDDEYKK